MSHNTSAQNAGARAPPKSGSADHQKHRHARHTFTRPAAPRTQERRPLGGGRLGTKGLGSVIRALILSLLEGDTGQGWECKEYLGRRECRQGGGNSGLVQKWGAHRRRVCEDLNSEGLGVGRRPAVPLGSSPPPGLSGFGAPPASSQLTRGAGELSGTPRPASLGLGGRAAIGQHAGRLGPPRSSDIRKR
ncbi:hypothetical protein NN561_009950 [Cricetulus griseus]